MPKVLAQVPLQPVSDMKVPVAAATTSAMEINTAFAPQIAINIQLHLPETENAEIYEKLFKALKEHLFPKV